MKFAIVTGESPILCETSDWAAIEGKDGTHLLSIMDVPINIDEGSFELIYTLTQNKMFNARSVIALDNGHVTVWR